MRANLFAGFAMFLKEEEAKKSPSTVDIMRHQFNMDPMAWQAIPIVIQAGQQMGRYKFKMATTVYVSDSDDTTVTLTTVPNNGITYDDDPEDSTGRIDMDPGTPRQEQTYVITRPEFEKLMQAAPATGGTGF